MKQEKRWVYYCDFCKKSGRSSGAMRLHEARCFSNPNRVCPLHRSTDTVQEPIAPIIAAIAGGDLEAAKKAAGDCPACVVSAITQERKQRTGTTRVQDPDEFWDYDYRKERDRFLSAHSVDY